MHGCMAGRVTLETMFSSQQRKARLLFELSDLLLTVAAFYAAYQVRLQITSLEHDFFILPAEQALVLGFCLVTTVALGRWMDVYGKLDSGQPAAILRDAFAQAADLALALLVFQYLLRLDLSRLFLGLFAAFSCLFFAFFRLSSGPLIGWVRNKFGALRYILIVGSGPRAVSLTRTVEAAHDRGLRIKGIVPWNGSAPCAVGNRVKSAYPVYSLEQITPLLRRHVIDEIVFAVEASCLSELGEVLLLCDEEGVRTRIAVDFFPHVNSEVYLERLGFTPLLTFSAAPHDEIRLLVKRATDVAIAAAGLVVLLPFMLAVALLVRLTSPGPAIFKQVRCGLNGRRFLFYKFRSMCAGAEQMKAEVMHLSTRKTATKIPDDPRLTRVGRYLRKFSIDEWPQLWNVLRGDMSLVGPRPAVPDEVEQYQTWQRRRLRMRPGLTCLWAVSGRDNLDFETWMRMDMQYIDNWSLTLDWKIILRTIPRVVTGHGAN